MLVTKENFQSIRENGIGNGFKVLNPEDGFRKDNRLWFGTCESCGSTVTNSSLTGKGWEHEVILEQKLHANGSVAYQHSKSVDYCPAV